MQSYFDESPMDEMIDITANIIQSRDSEDIQQEAVTKLDQLPFPLIGEIASYFGQKEHALFSRTNRNIFVGCNAPNTLTQLNLCGIPAILRINLGNYPKIRHLTISSLQLDLFRAPKKQTILKRLESVEIQLGHNHFQTFDIAFDHLNALHLQESTGYGFDFGDPNFVRFLGNFSKIRHLSLSSMGGSRGRIEDDKLVQLFPHLSKLEIPCRGETAAQFVRVFGAKLECLSLWERSEHQFSNVKDIHFGKLQKLNAGYFRVNTLKGILKTAKQLKEIKFWLFKYEEELQRVITQMITGQSSLEFLWIEPRHAFADVCDGIISGLNETRTRKRDILEIGLSAKGSVAETDAQAVMLGVSPIITSLIDSETKEFMVAVELGQIAENAKRSMLNAFNGFVELTPSVEMIKATKKEIIIGNKDCKMNKHEKWDRLFPL